MENRKKNKKWKKRENKKYPYKSRPHKPLGKILKLQSPPNSVRFCLNCNAPRTFKYNHYIRHSECKVCGCRFARKLPEKELEKNESSRHIQNIEKE